jgi:chemotaxis protein MotB
MKKINGVAGLFLALSTTACISQADFNRLKEENVRQSMKLSVQHDELQRLRLELNEAKALADTHQKAESTYKVWIDELEKIIEDQEGLSMTLDEDSGQAQIQVANTLLFKSGEIRISPEGKETLKQLSEKLKEAPGTLRIEGYTDNQPVQSLRTKRHSKDNWQLSVNRSLAVLRVLLSEGVPPETLSVAGYGKNRPVVENGPKGNASNRRVEIIFIPDPEKTEALSHADLPVSQTIISETELKTSDAKNLEKPVLKPEEKSEKNPASSSKEIEITIEEEKQETSHDDPVPAIKESKQKESSGTVDEKLLDNDSQNK